MPNRLSKPALLRLVGAALVGGGLAWAVARGLLPRPQAVGTFWPFAAGLAGAWLAGLASRGRSLLLRDSALAVGIAAGLACLMIAIDPRATHRSHFESWIPWVSWTGAAIWALGALWERRRGPDRRVTATLAGVALASLLLGAGDSAHDVWRGKDVRAWNVYHYHLGSKYFPELGYHDLYAATLAADDAWQAHKAALHPDERAEADAVRDLRHVRRARDMRTYEVVWRRQLVSSFDPSVLGPGGLEQLGAEVRQLVPWHADETWEHILVDLGYNPGPAWTVVGRPLAALLPLEGAGLWIVANSDVPLWLALVGFLLWGFGPRFTAAAVLFLTAIPFNEARFTGGLLQYDWLASIGIALALWWRGWHATAGVVLSWAAMTRVFPGFLIFPPLAAVVWGAARRRPIEPRDLRFVAGFVAACAVLFVASHTTGRGLATWFEWYDKIGRHSELHPITSTQRLGLLRLAVHEPAAGLWAAASGTHEVLLERVAAWAPSMRALALAFLVPALLARPRRQDAIVLMLYLAFIATVTSRYYGSAWMIVPLIGLRRDGSQEAHGVYATTVLLAMPGLMTLPGLGGEAGRYFVVNYAAWALFVGVCAAVVARRLRAEPSEATARATAG